MKWFRSIALILSIVGLLSIVGCKREFNPTIVSSDVSSLTANLPESSQEVLSSVAEEPVPGEPSVVESKPEPSMAESEPEPEVSSQPEPSSAPEEPSSAAEPPSSKIEPSESELPTIPFEVGYQERSLGISDYAAYEKNRYKAVIIHNEEELNQKFNLEAIIGEQKNYFEQCDAAYFEENAVIYIQLFHNGYHDRLVKIDSITRSEDQLMVNLYYDPVPGGVMVEADAKSTEDIFITVKKSDVEGITEIIGQRRGQAE